MAISVTEIQNRISSLVDQSGTAPTEGGTDWSTRLSYLNTALHEFEQLYDWQALYKEYTTFTSTSTGNTSISLPQDFRKFGSFPQLLGTDFPEIRPQEKSGKLVSDKYVYILGNPAVGHTMVVNSGLSDRQLPSGASIFVSYYATAGSLVSGSQVPQIPDPDFLVKRTVALHWEASDDARYQVAKGEADKILQRMLERENVHSEANNDGSMVRNVEQTKYSFRIGRN